MISAFIARWFVPASDSGVADDIRRGKSPWADSIHLLWSAWIFITPLFNGGLSGYNLTWFLFTLGTYPVFLLLFAKIQLAPRRMTRFYALGMAILCFGTMRWYPSSLSYFIYACVMLSHGRMRLRAQVIQLLLLNAIYVALAWRIGYPLSLLAIMPITAMIIYVIVMVEQAHKEKDVALRLSQDEVRRLAATAERERIGRDLHDLLGHTLSLITLKLELSRKLFDRDHEAARRELEEAERVARHALAEVRSAVSGIRAADIAAELASARLLLESSAVHLDCGPLPPSLPAEVERGLALVLREAVTNIARHARATQARVVLAVEDGVARLRIDDNGCGGVDAHGNGLSGMRERVRALGGTLRIESPRRQGTHLCIEVPLPTARLQQELTAEPVVAEGAADPAVGWLPNRRHAT
ncbi:two-component sensor histidine kinase [Rhodanobacter sp. C06]|uniref:sensor histidine kinase n=1 Tax=Rhodanobacter sp. C06 TaxID=1945854 RepID=UPI00098673B3|nr:sensor histidine kinase [Rhodanobacter sp. C06]OOG45220.1 two-component sensor histidine kinase [Rhodanobacter sp. C06]